MGKGMWNESGSLKIFSLMSRKKSEYTVKNMKATLE